MRTRARRAAAAALAALIGIALAAAWLGPAPRVRSFEEARARFASSDAPLLDRHGQVIHERRVDPNGRRLAWLPLAEVSPALVEAVVEAEDRRFREHGGVDVRAILGALRDAALGRTPRGASTLSMQLAALLDPGLRGGASGRGVAGKWRQMRAAWALERRYTKDEILEAYLNLVTFRGELQGVGAASRGLFDRDPHGLGEAEATLLAALLPSPNAAAPRVAARACRLAARRAHVPCAELETKAALALGRPPRLRPAADLAPHLAARLLSAEAPHGRVATTLDASLQAFVADVLARQVRALAGRNVRDAAALVVESASGDVLAWVGGSGSLASAPHVDGVRARRQAGSTLKPLLYAHALERRLVTAATRLDDTPLDVATPLGSYRPENYDHAFRGPVPVREALASSLNVPAVRLLQMVGVDDFVALLRRLGFAGLRAPDFYGDSLALGSAEVSLVELVAAYRTLARGGVSALLRIEPGAPAAPETRLFSPGAAFLAADILSDRAGRAPSFGLESALATRVWSAVKTGTSKDMRDNWCIGFTERFVVGVWVGNFSGAPMWDVSGVDGAAPAWLEIVHALHRELPGAAPAAPPDLVRARGEWYLAGTEPVALDRSAALPSLREARIVAPLDGARVALDPDIPDPRERLLVEASPADPRLELRLDGRRIGRAGAPLLWAPTRGRHEVALVDPEGHTLDAVLFSVR